MNATIDWEQQWKCHATNYRKGRAHIPLPNQQIIELLPGPGFGDHSHPTSRLMLDLMAPHVAGKSVFDIGSGSGILSVAAAKLGAKKNFFCDIDPEAETHTFKNGLHNGYHFERIPPAQEKPIILMNMISSEQEIAWKHHNQPFDILITSGILTNQRSSYLSFASRMGWQLLEERSQEGWLGFTFKENS